MNGSCGICGCLKERNLFRKMALIFFFLDYLTLENGTYRLSRNVSKELPLYAA
jgi:hypothetical protein